MMLGVKPCLSVCLTGYEYGPFVCRTPGYRLYGQRPRTLNSVAMSDRQTHTKSGNS